jgi:predicted permease
MGTIWQDVRHGARLLRHSPGFVAGVALTLGLGIGANAAVFSIVNTLLLRPLPVVQPENLYVLTTVHEGNEQPHQVSWKDYVDVRDHGGVFSDVSAMGFGFAGVNANNRSERITVSYVTGNFFSMLGIRPAYGRLILPTEGSTFGADPVIVLGHSYWKKRFGADPAIVGRTVLVNARPFTVIGVVPETFTGTYTLVEFDAYLPYAMTYPESDYKEQTTQRDNHELRILGRLREDLSRRQAQAAIDVLAGQLEQQYPDTNKTVRFRLFPERLTRPEPNNADSNPFVAGVFLTLVGLVVVVACVNVVNLLMVRATARNRELAVRAALGAGRARLVRQLLTESLLLAAISGVAGAILGRVIGRAISQIPYPADLPLRFELPFDWRVFTYIGGVALATGIVSGVVPALRASRTDVNDALREGGRGLADGGSRQWLRNTLVVAQVAVSLIVLIAAGLFVRSVQRAQSVDLGFEHANVLTLSMDVSQLGFEEARGRTLYREIFARVGALPGVETISYTSTVPFGYSNSSEYIEAEGQPIPKEQRRPIAGTNMVGPEYFRTMKIPIVRGRAFTLQDDAAARPVAIVNELLANKFWPGQDPIGKRFRTTSDESRWLEVVGVSKQGKYTYIFEDPRPFFFAPIEQQYRARRALQVRTTVAPESLAPAIEKEVRALEPNLPLYDVRSMTRLLDGGNGFFLLEMGALFAGGLGALGLVLALVGIYGVVSYSASQRTQEIGVRMALGAQPRDVLAVVVGRGLLLVGVGLVVGLAGAFAVSRLLANLLFGISALDPVTFVVVPVSLGMMAALASYIPAMRAVRIDPVVALRQ